MSNQKYPYVKNNRLILSPFSSISFHRTIRLPENDQTYNLPPSLGLFPLRRVEDYASKVPQHWNEHQGVFMPIYENEAMWMSFQGKHWHPEALQIAVGKINAINGEEWSETLQKDGYIVMGKQPWIDGIKYKDNAIKQFVAAALGEGKTVEGQITGIEEFGGIQLKLHPAKKNKFPDTQPILTQPKMRRVASAFASNSYSNSNEMLSYSAAPTSEKAEMGLGIGGSMEQEIYKDTYGLDTWKNNKGQRVFVHLINSKLWNQITGENLPSKAVHLENAYKEYPWFKYQTGEKEVKTPQVFKDLKTISELNHKHVKDGEW